MLSVSVLPLQPTIPRATPVVPFPVSTSWSFASRGWGTFEAALLHLDAVLVDELFLLSEQLFVADLAVVDVRQELLAVEGVAHQLTCWMVEGGRIIICLSVESSRGYSLVAASTPPLKFGLISTFRGKTGVAGIAGTAAAASGPASKLSSGG